MEESYMGLQIGGTIVSLLVTIACIHFANQEKRLNRMGFFLRLIGLIIGYIVIGGVLGMLLIPSMGIAGMGIIMVLAIAVAIYQVQFTVHRIQYCGWSKWCALILFIPLVNFIFLLVLLFKPGKDPALSQNVEEVFS